MIICSENLAIMEEFILPKIRPKIIVSFFTIYLSFLLIHWVNEILSFELYFSFRSFFQQNTLDFTYV